MVARVVRTLSIPSIVNAAGQSIVDEFAKYAWKVDPTPIAKRKRTSMQADAADALQYYLSAPYKPKPPAVETICLTEHVSSVRVLDPDGSRTTITELR